MIIGCRREKIVTEAKELSSGYVRVTSENNRFNGWAQMPKHIWDSLEAGEAVPDEYTFANECPHLMPILIKGR